MTAETATAGVDRTSAQEVKSPTIDSGSDSYDRHAHVEFDRAVEKRLIRKLDQRLVLLAFLCCTCIRPHEGRTWTVADTADQTSLHSWIGAISAMQKQLAWASTWDTMTSNTAWVWPSDKDFEGLAR